MYGSSLLLPLLGAGLLPFAACQSVSGPFNGALIGSKYPYYNMTQKLNHGNATDKTTFQQRFQVVTDFYKPGGPIFFGQSAEQPIVPAENWDLIDMAQELGGMVIGLEHRFFGASLPGNLDRSPASYAPLTFENVLDDAVAVVEFVKKNTTGAAKSHVIVEGGSLAARVYECVLH
jgi:hypothetical protein